MNDNPVTAKALEIIEEVEVWWVGDETAARSATAELILVVRGSRRGFVEDGGVVCASEVTIVVTEDAEEATENDESDLVRLLTDGELFPTEQEEKFIGLGANIYYLL